MTQPWLSVIVPAWRAEQVLPQCLRALRGGSVPLGGVELIVVDDGSGDATPAVAQQWADRVIRLPAPSGGPSRARNAGADVAAGEWLLFVDADVRIHPDTLTRFAESVARFPDAAAIFGTYDATPAAPGFVSQYRNLLHRWFHITNAGPAETFWAGLGGIRAEVFRRAGGFDAVRHPRRLEDIELGYRLRESGVRIVLDPSLEGTHLKGWSFARMALTDFRDRGLTWMRLVLEGGRARRRSLNLGWQERMRVMLAGAALLATLVALIAWSKALALVAAALSAGLLLSNFRVYRWFAKLRGWRFAVAVVPLQFWYYLSNAAAAAVGLLAYTRRRLVTIPGPSHA